MTTSQCGRLRTLSSAIVFLLAVPVASSAQAPSAESLEQWIRRGYSLTVAAGKTPEAAKDVRDVWGQLGWSGTGYGFRSFRARQASPETSTDQGIDSFASIMDHFSIKLDELNVAVIGDIGLAWGVHTEEFKMKDRPAETVRVRFTNTLRWAGTRWTNLLYHRDAQSFDDKGWYVRTPQAQRSADEPTLIYLVRHAEVDLTDPTIPLNAAGRLKAEALARAVSGVAFTHVFSSHTTRTRQMVEPAARVRSLSVQQLPRLGIQADSTMITDLTSSRAAIGPLVQALRELPAGSRALVGVNSDNVYAILNGLGVPAGTTDKPCQAGQTCVPCLTKECASPRYDQLWLLIIGSAPSRPVLVELRYGTTSEQ